MLIAFFCTNIEEAVSQELTDTGGQDREFLNLSLRPAQNPHTIQLFLTLAFFLSIANILYTLYTKISVPVFQSYIFESFSLAAAVVLTFFNHTRARNSSAILLIYWPLHSLIYGIWTRTALMNGFNHILFTLKSVIAGLGVLSFLLECVGPEWGSEEKISEIMDAENAIITANIFSRWFFMWMTPLMEKGASEYISENDLPSLRPEDASERLGQTLHDALQKHSLWKALFISYGGPYALAAGMKLVQDCLSFLQPQLLRWLLSYISICQSARYADDSTKPHPLEGFSIAVLMFVASVAQTVILNQVWLLPRRNVPSGVQIQDMKGHRSESVLGEVTRHASNVQFKKTL